MAAVLNRYSSGWHIDMMTLTEGDAGSVREAALKRDAVILPVLILNHRRDFDCDFV